MLLNDLDFHQLFFHRLISFTSYIVWKNSQNKSGRKYWPAVVLTAVHSSHYLIFFSFAAIFNVILFDFTSFSIVVPSLITWGSFLKDPELRPAHSVKLVFSYVVKGIKIRITSKFRCLETPSLLRYKESYFTRNVPEKFPDFSKHG